MKPFVKGDLVYIVRPVYVAKPGGLAGDWVPAGSVVCDRAEFGGAYVTDSAGSHWAIPRGYVCGVPEGHIYAADSGTTGESNPCLVCGCEIIVPLRASGNAEGER